MKLLFVFNIFILWIDVVFYKIFLCSFQMKLLIVFNVFYGQMLCFIEFVCVVYGLDFGFYLLGDRFRYDGGEDVYFRGVFIGLFQVQCYSYYVEFSNFVVIKV